MTLLYILIIVVVLLICFFLLMNKRKDKLHNASLSASEQDALEEDYITHGTNKEFDDRKNI